MHLYKREHNFFGGEGIVGTHVRASPKTSALVSPCKHAEPSWDLLSFSSGWVVDLSQVMTLLSHVNTAT